MEVAKPTENLPALKTPTPTHNEAEGQTYGAFMCYVVTYLRALESAREDRLFNDPFADALTKKAIARLAPVVASWADEQASHGQETHPIHYMSIRTRYVEEAIDQRGAGLTQVVLLGSGLDARAYRLESLRGSRVFEIDQSAEIYAHKQQVLKQVGAPLLAAKNTLIVADLSQPGWAHDLLASGFNPGTPTFWNIEGLLMYIDREDDVQLLKTIDRLSAPGSEFFGDMVGQVLMEEAPEGLPVMAHGEDDPLRGVYSETGWRLELRAELHKSGTHFGRKWTPSLSAKTQTPVRFDFLVGKKPAPPAGSCCLQ